MPRAAVDRDHGVAVGHGVLHAHRFIELRAELIEVNDLQLRALLDEADFWLQLP